MKLFQWMFLFLCGLQLSANSQQVNYYDHRYQRTNAGTARYYSVVLQTDSGYHRQDFLMHDTVMQMDGWFEDSALKIRNGFFTYYHPNKQLKSMGAYKKNKRVGRWVSFHPNGMLDDSTVYNDEGRPIGVSLKFHPNGYPADSTIRYEDGTGVKVTWTDNGRQSSAGRLSARGKPHGKWIYFHPNGVKSAEETYDDSVLISAKYFDEAEKLMSSATPAQPARFRNGIADWTKYINSHLMWPKGYVLNNGDLAIVEVEWVIDEEGKVRDVEITVPLARPFDSMVRGLIKGSPDWNPAIQNNRRMKTRMKQIIAFRQQRELR